VGSRARSGHLIAKEPPDRPPGHHDSSAAPAELGGPIRGWPDCLQIAYSGGMATEETTTVRVRRHDSEKLQSLAKAHQTTVVEVLHSAIDALERQDFLSALNGDHQRLREDPERYEQYLAERKEWDALA